MNARTKLQQAADAEKDMYRLLRFMAEVYILRFGGSYMFIAGGHDVGEDAPRQDRLG